jgi:hypothetical protein
LHKLASSHCEAVSRGSPAKEQNTEKRLVTSQWLLLATAGAVPFYEATTTGTIRLSEYAKKLTRQVFEFIHCVILSFNLLRDRPILRDTSLKSELSREKQSLFSS